MGKRDNWTPEQREAERIKNRDRMRATYRTLTADQRSEIARTRRNREAKKARENPEWASERDMRRKSSLKRYYIAKAGDASWWEPRKRYYKQWISERRINEEFDAFLSRVGLEADDGSAH